MIYPLAVPGDSIDAWADIANTVTAGATVAATFGAFLAARAAWSVLRVERARDDQAVEDRRRAQAEMISCWLEAEAFEWLTPQVKITDGCHLLNVSSQPVTEVEVLVRLPDGSEHPLRRQRVLPPGDHPFRTTERIDQHGPIDDYFRSQGGQGGYPRDWKDQFGNLPVSIEFTDAAGARWIRGFDGKLGSLPT